MAVSLVKRGSFLRIDLKTGDHLSQTKTLKTPVVKSITALEIALITNQAIIRNTDTETITDTSNTISRPMTNDFSE